MQDLRGEKDDAAIRMMAGFGGGIGGMGSVCGAIIGAVSALGVKLGRGTLEEKEDRSLFPLCAEVYRRFGTEIETSHICREITGTDFSKPEEAKAWRTSPEKTGRCVRLVGKTAMLVSEILSREESKSGNSSG